MKKRSHVWLGVVLLFGLGATVAWAAEPPASFAAPAAGCAVSRLPAFLVDPQGAEPAVTPVRLDPRTKAGAWGCHFYGGWCSSDCQPCQCDSECLAGGGCWEFPAC
jgi:hypothetical protein